MLSAALTVNAGALEPASPTEIIRTWTLNYPHSGGDYSTYAVSADGKRILVLQFVVGSATPAGDTGGADPPLSITVAMYWTAGLKK